MAITDWPVTERPREILLDKGPQALNDSELLAIFLRTGIAGKSAVDIARTLLGQFGSLKDLLESDLESFCHAPGMGPAKYAQLQAALELGRRYLKAALMHGEALTRPDETAQFLISQLKGYQHEVFACLFLNNQNRIIAFEELFRGTLDSASVPPREVVKACLKHNAAAVIFAHNHPSGTTRPSDADRRLTKHLKAALALVDIRVLDHVIVGDTTALSFAEEGLI